MKINKKEVPDSFQAYLVEGASFTKKEEYPILIGGYDFQKHTYGYHAI